MITLKEICLILVMLLGVVMLALAVVAMAMGRFYHDREKKITDPEERAFCQKSASIFTVATVVLAPLGVGILLLAMLCAR